MSQPDFETRYKQTQKIVEQGIKTCKERADICSKQEKGLKKLIDSLMSRNPPESMLATIDQARERIRTLQERFNHLNANYIKFFNFTMLAPRTKKYYDQQLEELGRSHIKGTIQDEIRDAQQKIEKYIEQAEGANAAISDEKTFNAFVEENKFFITQLQTNLESLQAKGRAKEKLSEESPSALDVKQDKETEVLREENKGLKAQSAKDTSAIRTLQEQVERQKAEINALQAKAARDQAELAVLRNQVEEQKKLRSANDRKSGAEASHPPRAVTFSSAAAPSSPKTDKTSSLEVDVLDSNDIPTRPRRGPGKES